ncbi:MAG: SAM-dependent chlorinase/fluorinase [Proteobacteria bacterium]|nr:SAM-dependent chlorinase/fluorinase [Pseudomonadota bacterium]
MNITNKPSIVTLITDFGLQDEYVGVLKGVILGHAPEARIVDISHIIPPQSISAASRLLSRSYRYFPAYTVHLVVVDPGVGSDRSILAIAADCQYFVGPDNGVFTSILNNASSLAVHRVNTACVLQKDISSTFHGRDIMAPVAGRLAVGLNISKIGPRIALEQCLLLEGVGCTRLADTLQGQVVHIDVFGNLCTNIHRKDVDDFAAGHEIAIEVTKDLIAPLHKTYISQSNGMVLALYDSHDYLEVAITQGNAAQQLRLAVGAQIVISRR